jgi:hypothetical protein
MIIKKRHLRHTFAKALLDLAAYGLDRPPMPLPAIQQLLGHADIATTTIYTRVSADDLARMMGTLNRSKRKLCRTYLFCGYKASSLMHGLGVGQLQTVLLRRLRRLEEDPIMRYVWFATKIAIKTAWSSHPFVEF